MNQIVLAAALLASVAAPALADEFVQIDRYGHVTDYGLGDEQIDCLNRVAWGDSKALQRDRSKPGATERLNKLTAKAIGTCKIQPGRLEAAKTWILELYETIVGGD